MTADELLKLRNNNLQEVKNVRNDIECGLNETKRVKNIIAHTSEILDDLDLQFEQATGLDGKDITFLFFAVALHCVRWIFQPSISIKFEKNSLNDRIDSNKGKIIEKRNNNEFIRNHKDDRIIPSNKFYTWKQIIDSPVPYDAMHGSKNIHIKSFDYKSYDKELSGKNHHAITLGHDPVLGWIFGTMNIITRTISFKNIQIQTYNVKQIEYSNEQIITDRTSVFKMFSDCILSIIEDPKRLIAAISKQGAHIKSDECTKMGLPIPVINANLSQRLLEKGWNSIEMENLAKQVMDNLGIIGIQFHLATFIDLLISALHILTYKGELNNVELYEVKTRKILMYSNVIASSSNIIYVAMNYFLGNENATGKIDIGGIINTIYRLIVDRKFIQMIKEEFIFDSYKKMIQGEA